MKRLTLNISLLIIVLFSLSACSTQEGANIDSEAENDGTTDEEEITLIWASDHPERYEVAKEAIEEKFPHITIEFYTAHSNRESLQEMLAAQVQPDIYNTLNAYRIPVYMESQLAYDMDELVEAQGFDLERIEPGLLSRIRSYALNQELYLLPYEPDLLALFYNKDIFDLFGVEYPSDGMTWDEILNLARQLTKEYDGTQYYGLEIWNPFFPGEAYDVTYVDPDTDEPVFTNSTGLRAGFDLFKEMRQIPGNNEASWVVNGQTAMSARFKDVGPLLQAEEDTGLNWDMVSWPTFEDLPGITPVQGGAAIGVSATSQYKEQAFEAFTYLLSDEYQIKQVRKGLSTPLADKEIQSQIYADDPRMADKNTGAFFYHMYNGGPERRSIYDNVLDEFRGDLIEELANGSHSVPEILREYEDRVKAVIDDQKSWIEN
ncbi:ABC transporter substrate-binding protein [Bacillus sp. FSL K6-3431]|uniref:ABC transporter substrate-binding protein n=1 Tax=Bacillus sp. FSL K6-3431 TaxID=2921500 RepID=UPI0030F89A68